MTPDIVSVRVAKLPELLQRCRAQGSADSLLDRVMAECDLSLTLLAEHAESALFVRIASPEEIERSVPVFDRLQVTEAVSLGLFLSEEGDSDVLVIDDPWDVVRVGKIAERVSRPLELVWARGADIRTRLDRAAASMRATDALGAATDDDEERPVVAEISLQGIERASSPVVRFVDSVIFDAWRSGASDIHIESGRGGIVVKNRLDGVLVTTAEFADLARVEEVLNRIKVMAQLDISERRVPQDGRFRVRLGSNDVDFRVSIMPSIFGEDAVIRLLDKSHLRDEREVLTLEALGFSAQDAETIADLAAEPHGLMLVTGPTGSGKTTTLYAVLSAINSGNEKIVTIEDPVEYELSGVLQIPVNEKKGLTFSRGLRSILRHDPDKILVGEIRDAETAEIAVQAALTGHGVYTTVHANNTVDVMGRLTHMGIDLYSLSAALNGVISQRLLRRICPACAEPAEPGPKLLRVLEIEGMPAAHSLQKGRGCPACRNTGYRGRFAVPEVLPMDDDLRDMIVARAPKNVLKAAIAQRGVRTLRQRALEVVVAGSTTEEEFRRVVSMA